MKLSVQIKKDPSGLFAHVYLCRAGHPVLWTTMDPDIKRGDPRITKLKCQYTHDKTPQETEDG
jgi:hypothetical protein